MHTEAHLFSVPNDCLWYDKLWGPSQRVVTLFFDLVSFFFLQFSEGVPYLIMHHKMIIRDSLVPPILHKLSMIDHFV